MNFTAGDHWDIGGVEARIVTGRKGPDDLRLDLRAREFVPVKMSLGFLFADFFAQNEGVLYPTKDGFQGGDLYLHYLKGAVLLGWEAVAEQLEIERARKRERRAA